MTRKALAVAILAAVLSFGDAAVAQSPTVPQVAWELGNLRGLQVHKTDAIDFLLKYTVTVPEGTADLYTVSVDVCRWVPVKNNVPSEQDDCSAGGEAPVSTLTEVEPGRVYEGAIRFGYDPSQLEFGKVNRYSYTLSLRRVDAADPTQVIAKQEFNDVIFARKGR